MLGAVESKDKLAPCATEHLLNGLLPSIITLAMPLVNVLIAKRTRGKKAAVEEVVGVVAESVMPTAKYLAQELFRRGKEDTSGKLDEFVEPLVGALARSVVYCLI